MSIFSDATRQRLEALNRGPLPAAAPIPAVARPISLPQSASSPARTGLVNPIPGLVRRGDVASNEYGSHLVISICVDELWPGGVELVSKRVQHLLARTPGDDKTPSPLASLSAAFPQRLLLLDLETCGLAGSALFLVGLLREIDSRLCVELLLARDYSEEQAVLASLWQRISAEHVLVTFNGKSFDWPMVVDRSRRHLLFRGTRPPAPMHIDLLHHARRRWRMQLPDCKLQTLERHICRRLRADDMPGSQIPAAYNQYVRTGFEREIDSILMHNAIDLVTLLDLAMRLAE